MRSGVLNALIKLRRELETARRTNEEPFRVPEQYCLYDVVNEAIEREEQPRHVCDDDCRSNGCSARR